MKIILHDQEKFAGFRSTKIYIKYELLVVE